MLTYLSVQNLGVLETAVIEPDVRMTVITGETGAGKTLLVGALRLLMGDKPRTSTVGPFGSETRVDGLFQDGDTEIGVGRRVPKEGRSQAFLEGSVVSASVLADRVAPLVEIAGQHDHLGLRSPSAGLRMLDSIVSIEDPDVPSRYERAWKAYQTLLKVQVTLGGDRMALERELDLVAYQAREIEDAGVEDADDGEMEALAGRLRNAEAISDHVSTALGELDFIADRVGIVVSNIRHLADLDGSLEGARESADGVFEELSELRRTMEGLSTDLAGEQANREQLEGRLNLFGDLKRKYGKTLREVAEYGQRAATRADELRSLIDRASTIDGELKGALETVQGAGSDLSKARKAAGMNVTREVGRHLADLGLQGASLEYRLAEADPSLTGIDKVTTFFASDKRLTPGVIGEVASGGELSRLILALRLATRGESTRSLVFDEVDAGVGGLAALALGKKLGQLAATVQVITVTHLPQVAANADRHYVVDRVGTSATVHRVDGEERVVELARMLAGMPDSAGGRETAAELLAAAGR